LYSKNQGFSPGGSSHPDGLSAIFKGSAFTASSQKLGTENWQLTTASTLLAPASAPLPAG
jgi:hypothetical protein